MGKNIKIVADDKIPFLKGVLEPFAEVHYLKGSEITKEIVKDADALIVRTRTICNEALLKGSSVKIITTATIGFDHIDTGYCESNGIKWLNAPGCNSSSVKQYILSALSVMVRKFDLEFSDKTIGIVGVGNVGGKIAGAAKALGMNVLLNDPPRARKEGNENFVDLSILVEKSDIITFHVPLNKTGDDKTFHLADEDFFESFNKPKVVLNSSRGPVVKQDALVNAIKQGKILFSLLDVWENEPVINDELHKLVDIGTPHIAGYSLDGKANGTSVCVNALNDFFKLGMEKSWYPENIPGPFNGLNVHIDSENKSGRNVICDAVLSTYNILNDDKTLRHSPDTFEEQRGNYPVRREFQNYFLTLTEADDKIVNVLKALDFNIEKNK